MKRTYKFPFIFLFLVSNFATANERLSLKQGNMSTFKTQVGKCLIKKDKSCIRKYLSETTYFPELASDYGCQTKDTVKSQVTADEYLECIFSSNIKNPNGPPHLTLYEALTRCFTSEKVSWNGNAYLKPPNGYGCYIDQKAGKLFLGIVSAGC